MPLQRSHLAKIGGTDAKDVARNIVKFVFTKELGKKFSWCGMRGNIAIKISNVGKAMLGKYNNYNHYFLLGFNLIFLIVMFFIALEGASRCKSVYVEDAVAIKAFSDWFRHCSDKPKSSSGSKQTNAENDSGRGSTSSRISAHSSHRGSRHT